MIELPFLKPLTFGEVHWFSVAVNYNYEEASLNLSEHFTQTYAFTRRYSVKGLMKLEEAEGFLGQKRRFFQQLNGLTLNDAWLDNIKNQFKDIENEQAYLHFLSTLAEEYSPEKSFERGLVDYMALNILAVTYMRELGYPTRFALKNNFPLLETSTNPFKEPVQIKFWQPHNSHHNESEIFRGQESDFNMEYIRIMNILHRTQVLEV